MNEVRIEHINITVQDPMATAAMMIDIFDWRIRWQGEGLDNGFTVHVGGNDSYVALYSRGGKQDAVGDSYNRLLGFNHLAVVVDDLKKIEKKVIAAGLRTHSHGDYVPGRRFYFDDNQGLGIEVVSYKTD